MSPSFVSKPKKAHFGTLLSGQDVNQFTLDSGNGCQVKISEFGAAITSILLTNHLGKIQEVCLGYNNLESYVNDTESMGATVGRYANRIANSRFDLNGKTYPLSSNIPPHQIHGGNGGFGKQFWAGRIVCETSVSFTYTSPDGEMGYPGELECETLYTLTSDNVLQIKYQARTDKDTYVNLTNHAYFNLGSKVDIQDHLILINSQSITPLDPNFLVTGEIQSTLGSPFDLKKPTAIGEGLKQPNHPMRGVGGYDINYVIGDNDGYLKHHATAFSTDSHIELQVHSTQPCLQFYTGNNLTNIKGRNGNALPTHGAFCLEAQDYPNGMNMKNFPTKPLKVGEVYQQTIEYRFSI